jgi:hypothetical protein
MLLAKLISPLDAANQLKHKLTANPARRLSATDNSRQISPGGSGESINQK